MIVWVLILSLGANMAITIPNIATKADCYELAQKIKGPGYNPSINCYSYKAALEGK
jgi:hypothetical protein